MMLDEIISTKESSKFALLVDSNEQRALPLLKSFVSSRVNSGDHVFLLLMDFKLNVFNNVDRNNILCVSDPLCWNGTSNVCEDFIKKLDQYKDEKVLVVIDSLTSMILLRSVPYTCKILHQINQLGKNIDLVAIVHGDCHDSGVLTVLKHCAMTILQLEKPLLSHYNGITDILHKRASGKIIRKKEHYLLHDDFTLDEAVEVTNIVEKIQSNTSIDPTANLTFNLSLTDKEKSDRSKVPLPYLHKNAVPSESSGKIFYQPDEADDFDEEDPDDDLDI